MSATFTTLSTGVRICNFSSPHPFNFDDGSVLEACSAERAKDTMLESREVEIPADGWVDIQLKFEISNNVREELQLLQDNPEVDIILVPFPVMTAVREANLFDQFDKIRVCRVADRVTKVLHHDRFCV